jgi:hypothetical protein
VESIRYFDEAAEGYCKVSIGDSVPLFEEESVPPLQQHTPHQASDLLVARTVEPVRKLNILLQRSRCRCGCGLPLSLLV